MCYVVGYLPRRGPPKPDPLLPYNSFWSIVIRQEVARTQPFWVTIYTPPDAEAGLYSGIVKISTRNAGARKIRIRLRVWNFVLPSKMHLKTHFNTKYNELRNLYANMSDEIFDDVLFRYRVNSSEHRVSFQRNITPAFRVGEGNELRRNYRRFNEDMDFLINLGMNLYCIHMGDLHFHIGPKRYSSILKSVQRHLKRKEWLTITYLHLDPSLPRLAIWDQAQLARTASPEIKIVLDTSCERRWRDLSAFVDALIIHLDPKRPRRSPGLRSGLELWLDGTCKPRKHGALCISRRWVDHRRLFWFMWSLGVKGLVFDSVLPTASSKEPLLYFMENGPMNSARWEIVRDGIEDYEYLSLLEERIGGFDSERTQGNVSHAPKRIHREGREILTSVRARRGRVNVEQSRGRVAAILEACFSGIQAEP